MKERDRDDRSDFRSAGRDDLDATLDSIEDAGFSFPVRDETLARWSEKEGIEPSERFRRRVAALIHGETANAAPATAAGTFGETLASWRAQARLSIVDLARHVGLHKDFIAELEADEIYPETQPEDTWRRIAAALGRSAAELGALIANTPRTQIHPQGSPAARLDRKLWRDRAQFLTRDEKNEEAKLDARRAELLEALKKD